MLQHLPPRMPRQHGLAPLALDLKRQLAGFESVPLSPSGSGRGSFSRDGSGMLVPAPESELATYASGSTSGSSSAAYGTYPGERDSRGSGAKRARAPRAPLVNYTNAQDAGPVPTQVTQVEMPPSYNPEWADSSPSLNSSGTGRESEQEPARMNSIVKAAKGLI